VLEQMGLGPALLALIDGVQRRFNLPITLTCDLRGRFDMAIETAIYRAVQEALSNICKHAHASHSLINICTRHQKVFCTITDNGQGFNVLALDDKTCGGLGLRGIKERAEALGGTLQVRSRPGHQTALTVEIPL
jgi:two-component system, NarL family, sensor histidine kinase NreB